MWYIIWKCDLSFRKNSGYCLHRSKVQNEINGNYTISLRL